MNHILITALALLQTASAFSTQCQSALNKVAEQGDVCNAKTDKTNDACFCNYLTPSIIATQCANDDASWGLYNVFQVLKQTEGCTSSTKASISLQCMTALDALEQAQNACATTPWIPNCMCIYPASFIQKACAADSPNVWKNVYDATLSYQDKVCTTPIWSTQCQAAFNDVAMQGDVCRDKTDKTNDACFCNNVTPSTIANACAKDDATWNLFYLNATLSQGQGCVASGSVKVSSACSASISGLGKSQWTCSNSAPPKDCICALSASNFKATCASDPESAWGTSYKALVALQTGIGCPATVAQSASGTYIQTVVPTASKTTTKGNIIGSAAASKGVLLGAFAAVLASVIVM
ncbi:hypothetical protein BDR26DRAFT_865765 [Obelidium mucronatum]|nr:hypothetical protein BDR26DRAFT_865765 [Obelidium mucronatum]